MQFVEERDTCDKSVRKPVYELFNGKQWPLVVLEKYGLLFCCLPLLESSSSNKRPSLVELPGVSVGFDLLEQLAEFLGPQAAVLGTTSVKLRDLYNYLNIAAPFGSPIDSNPHTIKSVLQTKLPPWTLKQKQPAWKPFLYKGSPKLHFLIKEQIWAVQYDNKTTPDVWEIAGTIMCKAELEGLPDVSVIITVPDEGSPLDHIVVHPCVQSGDTEEPPLLAQSLSESLAAAAASNSAALKSRKLKFSPPLESFVLCQYMASSVPHLPIRGFYQMKGERVVKLLIQLKLSDKVKNQFEYCEVHIPFFNRGPIINADVSPTSAIVTPSTDKKAMIWNIGNKFPSKSLEMSMNATVYFGDQPPDQISSAVDAFCVGLNAYIEIRFKMADFTISGCNIDQRSVTAYPNVKPKLTTVREFCSTTFRIWNSHGDALMALPFSQATT
ncbi:AP-5 complex subunit mu-1-like isoform X3 [Corticium candelabrum]|nr:AP-5 complex subunit mu-1-like isoform X3 [Corticium candelabrum]